MSWIQSWLSGSLASYRIPVIGQVPMPLEWILTRTSAAFEVSRLEPNATRAKYFSVRS